MSNIAIPITREIINILLLFGRIFFFHKNMPNIVQNAPIIGGVKSFDFWICSISKTANSAVNAKSTPPIEKLVLDWRKKQTTRAKVKEAIEIICDETLPEIYDKDLFQVKCNDLYNHFYDNYNNAKDNIYNVA